MNTASTVAGLRGLRRATARFRRRRRQRQHVAHRAVTRAVSPDNLRQRNDSLARQALAQRHRQIAHVRHVKAAFGVQRAVNLRAAIGRLAQRLHKCPQFLGRLAEQVHGKVGVVRRHLILMITRGRWLIFCRRGARAAI